MSITKTFPTPWKFEWKGAPMVKDAEGKCVAIISTGTLRGSYDYDSIIELGEAIAESANESV